MPEDHESIGFSISPYPGLRSFTRDEADVFFGRDEHVDQLLSKLDDHRFLAVTGTSGSGKSSLVRAGLIASLEAGFMVAAGVKWSAATCRPGRSPFANLADALLSCDLVGQAWREYPDAAQLMTAAMSRGPNGIADVVQESRPHNDSNLLIVVDQFEEIFRFHHLGNRNEAIAFVDAIVRATQQSACNIYIVITMRSDFLGDCALFHGLPEAINRGQFLVPRLDRAQMREAIVGPAAAFGCRVEDSLVTHMLNDLRGDSDQLPILQHCLMRMWDATKSGKQASAEPTLTNQCYEDVGQFQNALSIHADEAFHSLTPEQQDIASSIFRGLTERSDGQRDTRRPMTFGSVVALVQERLGSPANAEREATRILNEFRRADRSFLMPPEHTVLTADTIIDISHESLIRQWPRLRSWVDEEANEAKTYRRLVETAQRWQQKKSALWRGPDLQTAVAWRDSADHGPQWAQRYGGDYELALAFLDASSKAKRVEKNKRIVAALAVGCLLLFIGVAYYFQMRRERAANAKFETGDLIDVDELRSLGVFQGQEFESIQRDRLANEDVHLVSRLRSAVFLLPDPEAVRFIATATQSADPKLVSEIYPVIRQHHDTFSQELWPIFTAERPGTDYSGVGLALGVCDPDGVAAKIRDESVKSSSRRALMLSLEGIGALTESDAVKETLQAATRAAFSFDTDKGIHSAAEWLLTVWRIEPPQVTEIPSTADWSLISDGSTMVMVDPQSFQMGSPRTAVDRLEFETPARRVEIRSRYAIATKEITLEQFEVFFRSFERNPEGKTYAEWFKEVFGKRETARYPSTQSCPAYVTWDLAAAYCNWLSRNMQVPEEEWCFVSDRGRYRPKDNYAKLQGFRLPTEAEWECACRAGTTTSRYFSDTTEHLDEYAWYSRIRTQEVGRLKPNAFGLFDTLGNAWEWCFDSTNQGQRAQRGASVDELPEYVRATVPGSARPGNVNVSYGFRVVCTMSSD